MKKSILLSLVLGVFLFSCQTNDNVMPSSPDSSAKSTRTATIVYSNDFEATPIGWSVYVWSWSTGYATNYAGSKRLDQANLLAVRNRTQTFLVKYQTSTAINFATSGTYTMTYSTITTPTSLVGAGIDVVLVDAITGSETIIDSVPLTSVATPLTTRTATFSIAVGSTQHSLKLVPKNMGLTISPTLAGHCYFDNIVIQ